MKCIAIHNNHWRSQLIITDIPVNRHNLAGQSLTRVGKSGLMACQFSDCAVSLPLNNSPVQICDRRSLPNRGQIND